MALKATIYKADLQIADMDRHYYGGHNLTIARHPSENDERMMLRVLAFALNANENLAFTKGLCDTEEPDIWEKDLTGAIRCWIELGQPDEKRLRQICAKSERVIVYCYNGNSAKMWWEQSKNKALRLDNLKVFNVNQEEIQELAKLANRSMQLQCTIQEEQIWLADQNTSVQVHLEAWKP